MTYRGGEIEGEKSSKCIASMQDVRLVSKKRNVLIVGYPKSGTTWLTRLTAEVVGCPAEGFWGQPWNPDIAIEGQERESDFRCYKSHHQQHELETASGKPIEAVIYIVRDPRDVIVSGSRHFQPARFGIVDRALRRLPPLNAIYERLFNIQLYRVRRMMNAVLYGDDGVHHWCRIPWESHVLPYADSSALFLRYEDLLKDTERVCDQILDHIEIHRADDEIEEAVSRQSMQNRKKQFLKEGKEGKADFMRSGSHGQWKKVLTSSQVQKVNREIQTSLTRIGYK